MADAADQAPLEPSLRGPRGRGLWRELVWATAGAGVAALAAAMSLGLAGMDLRVPFVYGGDALQYGYFFRSLADNGTYLEELRLGFPFGATHHDFPNTNWIEIGIARVLLLVSPEFGSTYNFLYVLSYATVGASSYAVLRTLGLGPSAALIGSIAFNLLPFHLLRPTHLFYANYLAAAAVFWLALKWLPGAATSSSGSRTPVALVLALVVAGTGVYYAFFSCIVLALAGLALVLQSSGSGPLRRTIIVIAVVSGATAVSLIATKAANPDAGGNPYVAVRSPAETEYYGLRIAQLVFPAPGHRVDTFAELAADYSQRSPFVTENRTASLGALGLGGFIALLLTPLFPALRRRVPLLLPLSIVTLGLVLFATNGGFGTVFAWLVTPEMRALNRVSPFIGFACIAAALLVMQSLLLNFSSPTRASIYGVVLCLVLADQTSPNWRLDLAADRAMWQAQRSLYADVERRLPERTAVLQLPYQYYPESPQLGLLGSYDQLTPYLHTEALRFSAGGMRGRAADRWHADLQALPLEERLRTAAGVGFGALHIDWRGFDEPAAAELQAALSGAAAHVLATGIGEAIEVRVLPAPLSRRVAVSPADGWYGLERAGERQLRWSDGPAGLVLANGWGEELRCEIDWTILALQSGRVTVRSGAELLGGVSVMPGQEAILSLVVRVPPGSVRLRIESTIPAALPGNGDPRRLAIGLLGSDLMTCGPKPAAVGYRG